MISELLLLDLECVCEAWGNEFGIVTVERAKSTHSHLEGCSNGYSVVFILHARPSTIFWRPSSHDLFHPPALVLLNFGSEVSFERAVQAVFLSGSIGGVFG